jgi:hypothetical protein
MQLLLSGLLYLSGIAIVLWLRPALMFNENGTWKEFGIGRGSSRYTWLPFWLFAIAWALMSYTVVFAILPSRPSVAAPVAAAPVMAAPVPVPMIPQQQRELLPGYYMLNTPTLNETGIPRYVFVGQAPPTQ